MGKRRRGSSTRKHKVPIERPNKQKQTPAEVAIHNIELEIQRGRKGKPLSNSEITKLKVRIAMLEHQTGIKHD